nr:MAG TPA: hypothetical protein [Caudoviricetes sp.]
MCGCLCRLSRGGQGNALRVCPDGYNAGCLLVFNQALNGD